MRIIDIEDDKLPKTIKQAVSVILPLLTEEEKQEIKSTPKVNLILYHHGLGTNIRNICGLWGRNPRLIQDCRYTHPDDASFLIIESLWDTLHCEVIRQECVSPVSKIKDF